MDKVFKDAAGTSTQNPNPSTSNAASAPPANQAIVNDYDAELPSKHLKTQKSIKSSFEEIYSYTSATGDKAIQINNAILYMICKDNQPFSIVEDEGFQNLLKVTAPHYKIPSRATVTRLLDSKYDVLSTILKYELSNVAHLTLSSDIWSDMQMRSFLGVTAHFGLGTEFQSVTLGAYQLDERHTSEYIAQMLIKTCTDWGFDTDKVSRVVNDNAANMVKAVEITFGTKKHIPCFAHTLNLVAQNILKISELQMILSKIKAIVTFFKQSCVASDDMRKFAGADTKLIQDVPTRWNSTYYMIQRFLELKKKLKTLEIDEPLVMKVYKLVLKEITKRMGAIEQVSYLSIATVLDPRFKKLHFKDPLACANAVQEINDMMKRDLQEEHKSETGSDISDKGMADFIFWSDHHKLVHRNWKSKRSDESVTDELSIYLRTPVSRLSENPLKVWADDKQQFPKLYKIAYKYLTLVASSIPSERLFSKASQVVNEQRNRLKGKRVNKILFMQSLNKHYWAP